MKNGSYFLSFVPTQDLAPGVWDPFAYRSADGNTLDRFLVVRRAGRSKTDRRLPYAPIEYRHIHSGSAPLFQLERVTDAIMGGPAVDENVLLFGTMRAYLGNALVTPRCEWLGHDSTAAYSIKSEFVEVIPKDGLVYFWWAFLRSPSFLSTLPIGSGGTRPRLDADLFVKMTARVPSEKRRREVHETLTAFARRLWFDSVQIDNLLDSSLGSV